MELRAGDLVALMGEASFPSSQGGRTGARSSNRSHAGGGGGGGGSGSGGAKGAVARVPPKSTKGRLSPEAKGEGSVAMARTSRRFVSCWVGSLGPARTWKVFLLWPQRQHFFKVIEAGL